MIHGQETRFPPTRLKAQLSCRLRPRLRTRIVRSSWRRPGTNSGCPPSPFWLHERKLSFGRLTRMPVGAARMRVQDSDFLDKNVALAQEVRRTFADLDRVENELKKAKAITSASGLVTKYRGRLQELCDNAPARKMPPTSERSAVRMSQ